MKNLLSGSIVVCLSLMSVAANAATELQTYVQKCQTDLAFTPAQIPVLNCNDAYRFAGGGDATAINDFFNYKKINDSVDLTYACRWLDFQTDPTTGTFKHVASVELLIHNRLNGSTCFFSAKDDGSNGFRSVSTSIVSPSNFPAADAYWRTPTELNTLTLPSDENSAVFPPAPFPNSTSIHRPIQCVGCHVEGPYIASPNIAPFLARFGLLNDGHDTVADVTLPVGTPGAHYRVVGSGRYNSFTDAQFGKWENIIYSNIVYNKPAGQICSGACHSIGYNSPIGTLFPEGSESGSLLPSLIFDIGAVQTGPSPLMPPSSETSDYRWINRDNPGADATEIETFTASNNSFPILPSYCGVPTNLEAHAVGSDSVFSTAQMATIPDKLKTFNLREGLVCLNADQSAGRTCADYKVSYECPDGRWLDYINNDSVSTDNGDHEERSAQNSYILYACGGYAPVGIRAQFISGGMVKVANGPNDKLSSFLPTGLVCKNSDQPSGQSCSSYVVRYRACQPRSTAWLAKLKNVWTNGSTFSNRFVTGTNQVNNDAETRGQAGNATYISQDWAVEAIAGGGMNVRLRDTWSNRYLTASSNTDQATVVVHNSDTALDRQKWVIEDVSGSTTEKKIRNVGTGRYLTVGNYTTDPYYAPIISQTWSSQNWASQRWIVQ